MKHKRKWVFWLRWPLYMACAVGGVWLTIHGAKLIYKLIPSYYPYKPVGLSIMLSIHIMVLTMIFSAWAIDVLLHKIAMDEIVEPEAKKRENRVILKYEIIRYLILCSFTLVMGVFVDVAHTFTEFVGAILEVGIGVVLFFAFQRVHNKLRKKLLKAIKEMRLAERHRFN